MVLNHIPVGCHWSFLYNVTLDNSNHVLSAWQVGKKHGVLKSELLKLAQNNSVSSLSLLFCHSSSNSGPSILACTQTLFYPLRWRWINPPRFLFFFHARSTDFEEKRVCEQAMSIPLYFVALLHSLSSTGYLLQTPDNSNFFRFP